MVWNSLPPEIIQLESLVFLPNVILIVTIAQFMYLISWETKSNNNDNDRLNFFEDTKSVLNGENILPKDNRWIYLGSKRVNFKDGGRHHKIITGSLKK